MIERTRQSLRPNGLGKRRTPFNDNVQGNAYNLSLAGGGWGVDIPLFRRRLGGGQNFVETKATTRRTDYKSARAEKTNPPPTPASGGYLPPPYSQPPSFPPKGGGLANATHLRKSHIAHRKSHTSYRISHTPPFGGAWGGFLKNQ